MTVFPMSIFARTEGITPPYITNPITKDNGSIKYYVDEATGAYKILPIGMEADFSEHASHAIFEIDGKSYVFGKQTEDFESYTIPTFTNEHGTTQTSWVIPRFVITQSLNIISADGASDSHAVYVAYDIEKTGEDESSIEVRLIIDTQYGVNDDTPPSTDNNPFPIQIETTFEDIPQVIRMNELTASAPWAYSLLTGDNVTTPNKVALGHMNNLAASESDYTPDKNLYFLSDDNKYNKSNSAMALDYTVEGITEDNPAHISTIYGYTGLSKAEDVMNALSQDNANVNTNISEGVNAGIISALDNDTVAYNDGIDFSKMEGDGAYLGALTYPEVNDYTAPLPVLWDIMVEDDGDQQVGMLSRYFFRYMSWVYDMPSDLKDYHKTVEFKGSRVQEYLNNEVIPPIATNETEAYQILENFTEAESSNNVIVPQNVTSTMYQTGEDIHPNFSLYNLDGYDSSTTVDDQKLFLPWIKVDKEDIDNRFVYSSEGIYWSPSDELDDTDAERFRIPDKYFTTKYSGHKKENSTNHSAITRTSAFPIANYQYGNPTHGSEHASTLIAIGTSTEVPPSVLPHQIPSLDNFIRPIFVLNPDSVIFAAEIVADNADGMGTIEADDEYYEVGIEGQKNYKLTIVPENPDVSVGTITASQLAGSEQELRTSGLTIDGIEANPTGNPNDYRLAYKIVGGDIGDRKVVSWGYSTDDDLSKIEIANDDAIEGGKTYDVYIWLQKDNEINSHEASEPIAFSMYANTALFKITSTADADSNAATISGENNVAPGEIVSFSGGSVKNGEKDRLLIKVYNTDNEEYNVPFEKNGETYSFIMPSFPVTIEATAIPKDMPIVSIKFLADDEGASFINNINVSPAAAYAGTTVTVSASVAHNGYYLDKATVYKTKVTSYEMDNVETEEIAAGVFAGSNEKAFGDNGSISFVMPPGGEDIVVYLQTATTPTHKIVFDTAGLDYLVPNDTAFKQNADGNYETNKILPGQRFKVQVSSKRPYGGFELAGVDKSDPSLPDIEPTSTISNINGNYSISYVLDLPAYSKDSWQDGSYTLRLKEKKIYHPYTISTTTPNSYLLENLETITVKGERLGQIIGGDGLDLLEDESKRAAVQNVSLKTEDGSYYPIAQSNIDASLDGSSLTIKVPKNIKDELMKIKGDRISTTLAVGTKTTSITFVFDEKLRLVPFALMAIAKNTNNQYSVVYADNESELNAKTKNAEIVLSIKGDFLFNTLSNSYQFQNGSTLINGVLTYVGAALNIQEQNGSVTISARTGSLSVPGMTIFKNGRDGFSATLASGKPYTSKEYKANQNVRFSWGNYAFTNEKYMMPLKLGMEAELNDIVILENSIAFGGKLIIKYPQFIGDSELLNINMQRLQYGLDPSQNFVYEGVVASGEATIGMNAIPGISFAGAYAKGDIDTFARRYYAEVAVDLSIIEVEGKIALVPIGTNGLIPDELALYIDTDVGIPIVPGILSLSGGGGEVTGLGDTIKQTDPSSLPPLLISVSTTMSVVQVLKMKSAITMGPTQFSFSNIPYLDIGGMSFQPIKEMGGGLYWSLEHISLKAGASLLLFDRAEVIKGSGSLSISYNWVENKATFSGQLYCKVQIPKINFGFFTVGPIVIAEALVGITEKNLYAKVSFFDKFKLNMKYEWGKSNVRFSLLNENSGYPEAGDTLSSIGDVHDIDGNVVGTMEIGGNVKLISTSISDEISALDLSLDATTDFTIPNVDEESLLMAKIDSRKVNRNDLIVEYETGTLGSGVWNEFELKYARSESSEEPYQDNEINAVDVNAIDSLDGNDISITFAPDASLSSMWRISSRSNTPFDFQHVAILPLEELTTVDFDGNDSVDYTVENLVVSESYTANVYLSTSADIIESGVLVGSEDVAVNPDGTANGKIQFNLEGLEAMLQTGTYYVHVEITGTRDGEYDSETGLYDQTSFSIMGADTPLDYTNPLTPGTVTGISVASKGNENVELSWDATKNDKGDPVSYEIKVFDEDGNPVLKDAATTITEDSDTTSESTQYTYIVDAASTDNTRCSATLSGLPADKNYIFEITPFVTFAVTAKLDENQDEMNIDAPVYGKSSMSNSFYLPIAKYPEVEIEISDAASQQDADGDMVVYTSGTFNMDLSAGDQDCVFNVYIGDKLVDNSLSSASYEGITALANTTSTFEIELDQDMPSSTIKIVATNKDGDTTITGFVAFLDTIEPPLFVEANADGHILADKDGRFTIKGHTEIGSNLTFFSDSAVDGVPGDGGVFSLDGKLPRGETEKYVTVSSSDVAGNTSVATVLVKMNATEGGDGGDKTGNTAGDKTSKPTRTGDSTNLLLWILLATASSLVLWKLLRYNRRNKKEML